MDPPRFTGSPPPHGPPPYIRLPLAHPATQDLPPYQLAASSSATPVIYPGIPTYRVPVMPDYVAYESSPPNLPNPLHRAIYNGRVDKFRQFIDAPASAEASGQLHNIYAPFTGCNHSSLYLAISSDQPEIAALLLDVYAVDYAACRQYHEQLGVWDYRWCAKPVLVACGPRECAAIRPLCRRMRVRDPQRMDRDQRVGLMVLLKRCNRSAPEVHWLAAHRRGDGERLAAMIRRLMYNGWLSFQMDGIVTMTLAAERNDRRSYMRLCHLFGHLFTNHLQFWAHMLQMSAYQAKDRQQGMLQLMRDVEPWFKVQLVLNDQRSMLMEPIMQHQQEDHFRWFAESIAEAGRMTVPQVVKLIEQDVGGCLLAEMLRYGRVEPAMRAVGVCGVDLLAPRRPAKVSGGGAPVVGEMEDCLLVQFARQKMRDAEMSRQMAEWVVTRWELAERRQLVYAVLHGLCRRDSVEVLRTVYCRQPAARSVLFAGRRKYDDYTLLIEYIELGNFDTVEYLVSQHPTTIAEIKVCGDIINACCTSVRGAPLLRLALQLPGARHIAAHPKHYMPLLVHALKWRMLENYAAIWARFVVPHPDPAHRTCMLAYIGDAQHGSLLAEAVWYRRPDVNYSMEPWRFRDEPLAEAVWYRRPDVNYSMEPWRLRDDPRIRLELVDSDDDEAAVEQKRLSNRQLLARRRPAGDPVAMPDAFYADERRRYLELFESLLAFGCQPHGACNAEGESLLHLAMRHDNLAVLELLLRRYKVDIRHRDKKGRNALHAVHRRGTLARLLQHKGIGDLINQRDANSYSPLQLYLLRASIGEPIEDEQRMPAIPSDAQLVRMLVAAKASVNQVNLKNGCTAAHMAAGRAEFCAVIVGEAKADIQLKNVHNETAAFVMGHCGSVLEYAGDRMGWRVRAGKQSMLEPMLRLPVAETTRLAKVLDRYDEKIRDLFRRHWADRTEDNRALLELVSRNVDWVRRWIRLAPADARGARLERMVFRFDGEAGLLLYEWMRDVGGATFNYLWEYLDLVSPCLETWRLVLGDRRPLIEPVGGVVDAGKVARAVVRAVSRAVVQSMKVDMAASLLSEQKYVEIATRFAETGAIWGGIEDDVGQILRPAVLMEFWLDLRDGCLVAEDAAESGEEENDEEEDQLERGVREMSV